MNTDKMGDINENKHFQLIADFDGEEEKVLDVKDEGEIGILPLRNQSRH